MKKLIIGFCFLVIAFAVSSCAKDEIKPGTDLPLTIKTFLSTHYSDQQIIESIWNKKDSLKTYEVKLGNLTDLEFNYLLEITDIDGILKLPGSVISDKISTYVSINYPENFITGWEMDEGKQEVELDNAMDLEFDSNNDFLRIDTTP